MICYAFVPLPLTGTSEEFVCLISGTIDRELPFTTKLSFTLMLLEATWRPLIPAKPKSPGLWVPGG